MIKWFLLSFFSSIAVCTWLLIRLPVWIIVLFKRLRLSISSVILLLFLHLLILLLLLRRLFISCTKWVLALLYILLIVLRLYYTKRTLLRSMECLNFFILRWVLFHNHLIFTHLIGLERLVSLTWIYSFLKMRKSSFWFLMILILGHFFY